MSKRASVAGAKKEKPKPPAVLVKELGAENEKLKEDLIMAENQLAEAKSKIFHINSQILSAVEPTYLKENFNISENTDRLSVTIDTLSEIINTLAVKRKVYETSIEAQLEHVEKQLTKLSFELAKMSQKTQAYEHSMSDLEKCTNLDQVKDKIAHMKFIAGKAYFKFEADDERQSSENFPPIVGVNGPDDKPELTVVRAMENMKKLHLIPPAKKLPGDTHINLMDNNLKLFLIAELSFERPSGNDWRRMAERVGIDLETISLWQREKLQYAMARVFAHWAKDPEASVRLLHRHLKSPDMKALLLAKRLSDFYHVD